MSIKITFLNSNFEYGKVNIMLTLDEISIKNIFYFHVSSSKLLKQCFIKLLCRMTKHDKKSISSRAYSYEPNFHIKTSREGCVSQFVVNEICSYFCLRVFSIL